MYRLVGSEFFVNEPPCSPAEPAAHPGDIAPGNSIVHGLRGVLPLPQEVVGTDSVRCCVGRWPGGGGS